MEIASNYLFDMHLQVSLGFSYLVLSLNTNHSNEVLRVVSLHPAVFIFLFIICTTVADLECIHWVHT